MLTYSANIAIFISAAAFAYGLISALQNHKNRKLYLVLAVTALIALGAILRLWLLGTMSFWVDEAISTLAARGYQQTGQPLLPSGLAYNRALPHVIVVAGFLSWFGDTETAARLPSVFFGIFSIGLVFLTGLALGKKTEGMIAAIFMTFNMWFIIISREARMYSMFQSLLLLSILFFVAAYMDETFGKKRSLALRGISGVLGIGSFFLAYQTHKLALTILPGIATFIIILTLVAKSFQRTTSSRWWINKHSISLLISLIIAIALYFVAGVKISSAFPQAPGHLAKFDYLFYIRYLLTDFPIISTLAVIGMISLLSSRRESDVFLLTGFVVPMIGMSFVAEKLPRYIYHLQPFLLILAGCGVVYVWGQATRFEWTQRRTKSAKNILIACLGAIVLVYSLSVRAEVTEAVSRHQGTENAAHSNWKKVAGFIDADTRDGPALIIPTDPVTAAYYFGEIKYFLFEHMEPGRIKDSYTNALVLDDISSLNKVAGQIEQGYIIIDTSHWNDYLSPRLKQEILARFNYEPSASDNTIWVFSWHEEAKI